MAYAETTTVPFERSIGEIVSLLDRAGADNIGQMQSKGGFTLQFTMSDRLIRFRIPFLTPADIEKLTGPRQDASKVEQQWRRQRGRALLLVIKAKLESVESDVETFEQAFLANVVLSNGETVYDRAREQIAIEYQTAQPSVMLLEGPRA